MFFVINFDRSVLNTRLAVKIENLFKWKSFYFILPQWKITKAPCFEAINHISFINLSDGILQKEHLSFKELFFQHVLTEYLTLLKGVNWILAGNKILINGR